MKLFELVRYKLEVNPIAWGYKPFKILLDRDKTKDKEIAFNEMLFIYSFADIRSDFAYKVDEKEREEEILKSIELPKNWVRDQAIDDAIEFYREQSRTINGELYESAVKSAKDISDYLKNTEYLLKERDEKGKPVNTVNTITSTLKQLPSIMKDLKAAYKELVKEQEEKEGRTKGAKTFNMFEDGL